MKTVPKALALFFKKKFGVKEGTKPEEYRRIAAIKIKAGKLTLDAYNKLVKGDAGGGTAGKGKSVPGKPAAGGGTAGKGKSVAEQVAAVVKDEVAKLRKEFAEGGGTHAPGSVKTPTPAQVFAQSTRVRVKSATEAYSATTKAAVIPARSRKDGLGSVRPDAGQPATFMGRALDHPSDLAKATSAAWVKWCVHHTTAQTDIPYNLKLTDHDRDLVLSAMHTQQWTGVVGKKAGGGEKVHRQKLSEFQVKGLLDDTISGGIEAAPIVFDEAIILIPVLYGELFPFVNVVNINKGRRVKGATMTNPTFTSGTQEGYAIQPFDTTGFVTAFDTPVHVASGAMEIGLDFEEDSPVDMGSTIIEKYGDKAMEWLDRVIAVGNGFNEPLGIFNTTGLTVLAADNGVGGPPTVSDYEGLMFGVAKQWRNEPGAMTAYIGSDTSYRRARAIQVGPADERRVFGMTHAEYMLLDRPYKVQNDIPNTRLAFANLKRYRMYRRLGLTVRVETAGRALALNNTKLLVVRMRYGGQMENAGAVSVIQNSQN